MRGYFSYIIVLAVLQSAKAVTFNARNLRLKQSPPGPTLVVEGPKTKVTLCVSSNESLFETLYLKVKLGKIIIQANTINSNLTVIYNSCTNSDNPQWRCKEVQITFRQTKGGEEFGLFQQMSFDLYRTTRFKLVYHLTTIELTQHSPTTLSTTTIVTTSEDTTSINSEQPGSNTEPLTLSVPVTVGIIVALSLVIVVLISVLVLVLLCVCCRKAGGGET